MVKRIDTSLSLSFNQLIQKAEPSTKMKSYLLSDQPYVKEGLLKGCVIPHRASLTAAREYTQPFKGLSFT